MASEPIREPVSSTMPRQAMHGEQHLSQQTASHSSHSKLPGAPQMHLGPQKWIAPSMAPMLPYKSNCPDPSLRKEARAKVEALKQCRRSKAEALAFGIGIGAGACAAVDRALDSISPQP